MDIFDVVCIDVANSFGIAYSKYTKSGIYNVKSPTPSQYGILTAKNEELVNYVEPLMSKLPTIQIPDLGKKIFCN